MEHLVGASLEDDVVFIVGAERSGTTLFRLILDNHPRVGNPGEFDFLFDRVEDDGRAPNMERYRDWLSTDRIFMSQGLRIDPTLGYLDLIKSFICQKAKPNRVLSLNVHRGFHKIPRFF